MLLSCRGLELSSRPAPLLCRSAINRSLATVAYVGIVRARGSVRSRQTHGKDYYRMGDKSSPIPIRWMAPETLRYTTSSSQSDVWSFGVLLWELFSLGCRPYTELQNSEIMGHISAGNRLPTPEHCPPAVYEQMLQCWSFDPAQRPHFFVLASVLDIAAAGCSFPRA